MNLLCSGMVPWTLKVFHGIIDASKEPLFIKEGFFPGALEEEKNDSLHK